MTKAAKKVTTKVVVEQPSILERPNLVHAMAYFPYLIGAIAMYFLGQTDKKAAMHHIKYSVIMAIIVIIAGLLLVGSLLWKFIAPAYIIGSAFLAWKAYNGEEVHIEILDTIEDKIAENVKK